MYYNKYYSGNLIGMPQPLYEDGVTYADGTKATQEQMAKDVTAFLAWASEPELEERKKDRYSCNSIFVSSYNLIIFCYEENMGSYQEQGNLTKIFF
jgi:cytochrome c1